MGVVEGGAAAAVGFAAEGERDTAEAAARTATEGEVPAEATVGGGRGAAAGTERRVPTGHQQTGSSARF